MTRAIGQLLLRRVGPYPHALKTGASRPSTLGTGWRALTLLLVAATLVAAQSPPPPNVLLVTIDTVRADHIGAYGYTKGSTPTLDRLAREGVRFADATSQAPLTGPAHAALLTGTYPARFGVRDNATTAVPASATTLAELFKARGYQTGAFIGAFIVGAQYGFGQGFDQFDDRFARFSDADKLNARRPGGEVTDAAVKWLEASGRQPTFTWVHLYDAHGPYDSPAPYRAKFAAAPYDGAIAYVDACIGRLVAALEKSGSLDRTIVAVVADHGESLGEHGEKEHGLFLYDAVLHVPWILRLPGRAHAGAVVATQVRSIDVMPTIAVLAGAPAPSGIDGESVVPEIDGRARRDPPLSYAESFYGRLHFGLSELKSLRVGDWKYIDAPRAELYQVSRDPHERVNLLGQRGQLATGLSTELNKIASTFGSAASVEAPEPDPETLARLQSLGYVGVTAPPSGGRGADPKDEVAKLEIVRSGMERAIRALQRGDAQAAIPILRRLLTNDDRSYELHLALGDAYVDARQYQKAVDEYAAASLLNPAAAAPLVAAVRAHLAAGNVPGAQKALAQAERLEPASGEVLLAAGTVDEHEGRDADAMAAYDAALAANASDASARARVAGMALQLSQLDKAYEQFTILLRMGYRPSRMHFGLGQIAQARGDAKTAAAEYRECLRLEPAFAPARTALAQVGGARH